MLVSVLQVDLQAVRSVGNCIFRRGDKRLQKALRDQGAQYAETQEQLQVYPCRLHVAYYMPHATVRKHDLVSSLPCHVCSVGRCASVSVCCSLQATLSICFFLLKSQLC